MKMSKRKRILGVMFFIIFPVICGIIVGHLLDESGDD